MQSTITFETYPDLYSDYENQIENEDYDNTMRVFTVPYDWYLRWLNDGSIMHGYPEDEVFQREYTWDDTSTMYDHAVYDDVVLEDEIEYR